jgi:hypothetical protein
VRNRQDFDGSKPWRLWRPGGQILSFSILAKARFPST